jgi:hypothetical protein
MMRRRGRKREMNTVNVTEEWEDIKEDEKKSKNMSVSAVPNDRDS